MIRGSPKGCVSLGTYRVEETRGLIDGMETRSLIGGMGTVGWLRLMVIMGALKTTSVINAMQLLMGSYMDRSGRVKGLLLELATPMERPTRQDAPTHEPARPVGCDPCCWM